MERNNEIGMLDLIGRPAFCAADGRVTRVNALAAAYHITPGMETAGLLQTGAEEYAAFNGGCLYLTLSAGGEQFAASVTRLADCDVFCLEQAEDVRELQSMALAARELRNPLNTVMVIAQRLCARAVSGEDPTDRQQTAALTKKLYQMVRVIDNMSQASQQPSADRMETMDISAVLAEIFEKTASLVAHTGVTLEYRGCPEAVYGLANREALERAVLNLVSNAVKFSSPGDPVRAALTRRGRMLYLEVENSGNAIPAGIRADLFTRYRRPCVMEDTRFGVGLGMVLIRSAAAAHGGTVLIDQPGETGTRVTMSLAIRQGIAQVRAGLCGLDSTGGMDSSLIALSECLPDHLYGNEF